MSATEKPLIELIKEHLNGNLQDLPVFNTVAVKLQQMLASRDFKMQDIIELISEDQALASQVLKVANSSYYSGLSTIATISEAIVRLGAQEVANMVMMASQHEIYHSSNEYLNSSMQRLWSHSLACATGARWLAKKTGYTNLASEGFMAGLLHDIGQLALLKVLDDIDRNKESKATFSNTLISEILDRMHQDVGDQLLRSWGLPESYCTVAGHHHQEEYDGNNILLVMVRLADKMSKKVGLSLHPQEYTLPLITTSEALYLGIKEMTLAELEIAVEDSADLQV